VKYTVGYGSFWPTSVAASLAGGVVTCCSTHQAVLDPKEISK
jgi:hypothetical protein